MAIIINFFKNFKFLRLKIYLSYLKNINHNPYSLGSLINPPKNVSDFFILDRDCNKVIFIAENIRAMILGREVKITHNFKFFSAEGIYLGKQTFETKNFFCKVVLNSFENNNKYISFIHYVESKLSFEEIFNEKGVNMKSKLHEQNRGYSVFHPIKSSSGSIVHGNFGGISKNLIKTAKKTFLKHIYTPIYKFEDNSKYDIVFNNPTNSILSIKVIFNNSNKKENLEIPSLGTKFLRFTKYKGSLSFESKLPICRPLIFKNPTPNDYGTFDVFHS